MADYVKRLIGNKFGDSRVQEDMKLWPFKVKKGSAEEPIIVFEHEYGDREFSSQYLSSAILKHLKEAAESYLGTTVTDAVITVPAYFNNNQRQATMAAAKLTGLKVLRLINEPTSAAIAYGLDKGNSDKERNVLIFDLGGGTFDVSLLNISKDGNNITVKAVGGDTHLGGEDFDKELVKHCVEEFKKKENKDMSTSAKSMMKLKVACEKAKRDLSSTTKTSIEVDSLYDGVDFSMKITRAEFEKLNVGYFTKCIEHVKNCLTDGNMDKKDVNDVVIIGGSTRIPKVQEMLREFFGGKQLCKSINTDEAVAYGAAVLASNLSGNGNGNEKVKDLILFDVTPLSLGIPVLENEMSVIVPRNTPIPTVMKRDYWIIPENRQTLLVEVYQGESMNVDENFLLESVDLDGIPPSPAFTQDVIIGLNIDENGIIVLETELISTGQKTSRMLAVDISFLQPSHHMKKYVTETSKNNSLCVILSHIGHVGNYMRVLKPKGKRRFVAQQAEEWWKENKERMFKK
ncbi:heat shock 70 kDa protein 3-like [Rutidosis leptorrhynchoides]|uniref:heat shock 70 kDa protein 3-like n=1 Tax=Rutidosis leptorrhynchoides TaxID=125765 RepID=UPI003A99F716